MDFSNTFAQTELETLVYLDVSKDCEFKEQGNMILELHWNLYGQVEAPKLWYKNCVVAWRIVDSELVIWILVCLFPSP